MTSAKAGIALIRPLRIGKLDPFGASAFPASLAMPRGGKSLD